MLNTKGWYGLWCLNPFLQYNYSNYIYFNQCQQDFTYSKAKLPLLLLELFDQKKNPETYSADTRVALLAFLLHFFFVCLGFGLRGFFTVWKKLSLSSVNWAELVHAMLLFLVEFSLKYQLNYWIFSSLNCLSLHLDSCLLPLFHELNALLFLNTVWNNVSGFRSPLFHIGLTAVSVMFLGISSHLLHSSLLHC